MNVRGFDLRLGCKKAVFFLLGGGKIESGLFGVASVAEFRLSAYRVWFLGFCFLVEFVICCFCQQGDGDWRGE